MAEPAGEKDCTALLLSAGYFRARIARLSPFDKVVGGLCWSITASGVGVDVDLFFRENSTIGQRIKLCENIVKALRSMKCPHPLQAHQITHDDFPALLPVIKWLVKKVIETRSLTGDLVRLFSENIFSKDFGAGRRGHGGAHALREEATLVNDDSFAAAVAQRYKPKRRYRRALSLWASSGAASEDERVHSCLLEYGEKLGAFDADASGGHADAAHAAAKGGGGRDDDGAAAAPSRRQTLRLAGFEKQYAAAQRKAQRAEEERREGVLEVEKNLLKHMTLVDRTSQSRVAVSQSQVAGIVGMQSGAIADAASKYKQHAVALRRDGDAPLTSRGRVAMHKRKVDALLRQIDASKTQHELASRRLGLVSARLSEIISDQERAEKYNARVGAEIAKLKDLEAQSEYKSDLAKLKSLVMLNESLKSQEAQFKANCKRQLKALQERLDGLQRAGSAGNEDLERLQEIENMYSELRAKYDKLRQLLAKRNQEVAIVSRKIDDIPTRTELIQYERRFVELYEEVASKLEETRKYFSTYNTLEQTHNYLQKEASLIQSINDTFAQSMKSAKGKDSFVQQFDTIIANLKENLTQINAKREERAAAREESNLKYQQLVDQQRRYFRAVKDFQTECLRNEMLTEQLE